MGFYFWRDSSFVTIEADAWGSITTPAGTFSNVLRIKRTTQSYTWNRFAISSPWIFLGMFESIDYDWFDPSIGINVFGIRKDLDIPGLDAVDVLTYYNNPVGIEDRLLLDNIDIAPNPASNFVNIISDHQTKIQEYTIYTLSGKPVFA